MAASRDSGTVTIHDVASAAAVSTATVSRVMNGVASVAPDLAARVRQAADALGYHPNAVAQGLVRGRTQLVGVVVPDLANPYFHGILKGIARAASDDDYRLLVTDAEETPEEEASLAQELLHHVDGVLLLSPRAGEEQLRALAKESRPVVCVNRAPDWVGLPCVAVDEYGGALAVCAHLLDLGHRRVLYLAGPEASWSSAERWRGIRDASQFGLEAAAIVCGSDMAAGHAIADQILETDATAVIAFNDFVASGVLARLRELKVVVPAERSLAGFDDIPYAAYLAPALTTVRTPATQLGARAWEVLAGAVKHETPGPFVRLSTELVIRASTAPPAG